MPDLTTLQHVKDWLAIPANQTVSDAALGLLITNTSGDFLRAINRPDFLSATYTEVREGDGSNRMILRHWPITDVSALTIGGITVGASTDKIAPGYFFDDGTVDPERLFELYLAVYRFNDAAQVVVNYTGGYAATPGDVEQAVIEWIADRYKGRPGQVVSSQRDPGGEGVTYSKLDAMPATTAAVVDRYTLELPSIDRRREEREYRDTKITRRYSEKVQP